jgi:hypothetical protein
MERKDIMLNEINQACSHSYVEAKKVDLTEVESRIVTGAWERCGKEWREDG